VRAAPVQEGRKEGRGSPKRSVETLASHSDQRTSGGGRTSLRRCARGGYFSQASNRLWAQVPVVIFTGVFWGWAPPGGGDAAVGSLGARGAHLLVRRVRGGQAAGLGGGRLLFGRQGRGGQGAALGGQDKPGGNMGGDGVPRVPKLEVDTSPGLRRLRTS